MPDAPTSFISYSWDDETHREWVRAFATRLRSDGVAVVLDQWHAAPGDRLPLFMEQAIRENQFVIVVCTPGYKRRSDQRKGGVGYEGDIITGDVVTTQNHRKYIPVLRCGEWIDAAPWWVAGAYYVDLRGEPYNETQYADLLATLHGDRPQAPPVGRRPAKAAGAAMSAPALAGAGALSDPRENAVGTTRPHRVVDDEALHASFPTQARKALAELDGIIRDAEIDRNIGSVQSRFVLWKERTSRAIKERFGEAGAARFSSITAPDFITGPQPRLMSEARQCRNHLIVLCGPSEEPR